MAELFFIEEIRVYFLSMIEFPGIMVIGFEDPVVECSTL
jgi:hypothetical protein